MVHSHTLSLSLYFFTLIHSPSFHLFLFLFHSACPLVLPHPLPNSFICYFFSLHSQGYTWILGTAKHIFCTFIPHYVLDTLWKHRLLHFVVFYFTLHFSFSLSLSLPPTFTCLFLKVPWTRLHPSPRISLHYCNPFSWYFLFLSFSTLSLPLSFSPSTPSFTNSKYCVNSLQAF